MKKLIYIFERRHYYEHDGKMFWIDYMKENGVDVEVWSAVYWTFGKSIFEPVNIKKGCELIYINNESELKARLNSIKGECLFVVYPYHVYTKASYIIRREIKKAGFKFCNLTENPDMIEMDLKLCTYEKALLFHFRQFLGFIKHSLIRMVKKEKNEEVIKATFWMFFFGPILWKSLSNIVITDSALNTFPNKFEIFSKRNIIFPHSDCYEVERLKKDKKDNNYIVFIDEYECGHSDWEKWGLPMPIQDKELYYKELDHFFSLLEKKFNCPVVVAAHPKSEYDGTEFYGRKIIYCKTKELIRDAKVVLYLGGTCGTCIALFDKPFILFCTSEALKGHLMDTFRIKTAKLFEVDILQIGMDYTGEDLDKRIIRNEKRNKELAEMLGWKNDLTIGIEQYILGLLK